MLMVIEWSLSNWIHQPGVQERKEILVYFGDVFDITQAEG